MAAGLQSPALFKEKDALETDIRSMGGFIRSRLRSALPSPRQDLRVVIAEGKVELPTAPVAPLSSKENKGCSMVSVKAPGVRGGTLKEPDAIIYNPDSDISKVRGYASLLIYAWAENDKVQFAVCNPTKYMILPGKAALLWQVWRSGAKDGKL